MRPARTSIAGHLSVGENVTAKTTVVFVTLKGGQYIALLSDGVHWVLISDAAVVMKLRIGNPMTRFETLKEYSPETRRLLEWLKTIPRPLDNLRMPRPQDKNTLSFVRDANGKSVNLTTVGIGSKTGAYRRAEIIDLLVMAITVCHEKWGWLATDIVFELHESKTTMGLAYRSGAYKETGTRRISISTRLCKEFDKESIYRTFVHELCHHYREETFPKSIGDSHDELFCKALRLVDPKVHDLSTCKHFHDQVDPAVVAAAKPAHKPAIWSPTSGHIKLSHLKSGKFVWQWMPGNGFKWSRTGANVNDKELVQLLQRFDPAQWRSVVVEPLMRTGSSERFLTIRTLRDFAERFVVSFPSRLTQTRALLEKHKSESPVASEPS